MTSPVVNEAAADSSETSGEETFRLSIASSPPQRPEQKICDPSDKPMTRVEKIISKLQSEFGRNMNQLRDDLWEINVTPDKHRHQMVFLKIRKKSEGEKDVSRFVCTSAIGEADGVEFEAILRRNLTLDIGTVAIENGKHRDGLVVPYLIFKASHLTATADYPEIWELVIKTGIYADKLEREFFAGKDVF